MTRSVVLLVFEGLQSLDLTGPLEVFTKANATKGHGRPEYRVLISSLRGGTVESNSGLRISGTLAIADLPPRIDTLVLAGGDEEGMMLSAERFGFPQWLRKRVRSTRRIASVCTGAFLLAQAGLLSGRRATTHWNACERFSAAWPDIDVVADAVFTTDPPYYTSAGITAGIDLCLALVEEDLGQAAALAVARDLVVFMRRPGGQSQFSNMLKTQMSGTSRLSALIAAIGEDPRGDLSGPTLAARAQMSERTFLREFKRVTGITPATWVQQVRIERARTLLETTRWPLRRIADLSGFGSVHGLHRAFAKHLDVTPAEYRGRFGSPTTRAPGS